MATAAEVQSLEKIFIGGEWVEPEGGERLDVINSSTEEPIGSIPLCTPGDADRAVRAANDAFESWSRTPREERAGYLGAIAAKAAFTEGDEWLDDVLATLDDNKRRLREWLPPEIGYTPPDASFLAWLDCRFLGEDPARTFLERGRVALSRGLDFGAQGAGFARLNFGTDPERLEEAVSRMAAALSR